MPMVDWLKRRLLLFGGKGGVGKTTCASAAAVLAARSGRKTLLISTDPAHSTGDLFHAQLGDEPTQLEPNLWALEIDADLQAERYIDRVRRHLFGLVRPQLRQEVERQIEMARLSPGAIEAALFDRIADLVEEGRERFDLLAFDTAPTGHTLRLLTLPEQMQAWIEGLLHRRRQVRELSAMWRNLTIGRGGDDIDDPIEAVLSQRRRRFYKLRRALLDDRYTGLVFVLTAERLPILETARALTVLRLHRVPVAGLIINRVLPEEADAHPFFSARRAQEAAYLREIDDRFATLPRLYLRLLPYDVGGRKDLDDIAQALAAAMTAGPSSTDS